MTTRVCVLLSVVVVLAALLLGSCGHYICSKGATFGGSTCSGSSGGLGTGGSGGTAAAFAFMEDQGIIYGASLDTSGNFALIPNFASPGQTLSGIGGMVIVQKKWMYIALTGGLAIQAYSINGTTGALTKISGSPYSSSDSTAITADPAGKFLFLCGQDNDHVSVFSINQTDGSLTLAGTGVSAGLGFAVNSSTDGLGQYLYVTQGNLGNAVAVFKINSDGSLTPAAGNPYSVTIAQLRGEPTGKFMLGITGNGANNGFTADNNVYVYPINSDGSLGQYTKYSTKNTPATFAVHPSGKLVYTFNGTVTGATAVEGFTLDSTGKLTELTSSPFTTMVANAGLIDDNGTYLFLHPGTSVSVQGINTTTGALTAIGQPITGIGGTEGWAVTDPH